jgi:hypothetical protein
VSRRTSVDRPICPANNGLRTHFYRFLQMKMRSSTPSVPDDADVRRERETRR